MVLVLRPNKREASLIDILTMVIEFMFLAKSLFKNLVVNSAEIYKDIFLLLTSYTLFYTL